MWMSLLAQLLTVHCTFYISSSIAYSIFYSNFKPIPFSWNAQLNLTNANRNSLQFWRTSLFVLWAFIALNRIYWIRNTAQDSMVCNLQSLSFTIYIVYSLQIIICHWIYFSINVITKVTGTSEQQQRKH